MRLLVKKMIDRTDALRRGGAWKQWGDALCCVLFVATSFSGLAWFISYVGALRIH